MKFLKNMFSKLLSRSIYLLFLQILGTVTVLAQTNGAEMADVMRQSGKIYVVVAVILIVFIGLVLYLIHLDRKIKQLEQQTNGDK